MKQLNRFFFLDNLRGVVILLVVIHHGLIAYMSNPPEWWYVINPENSRFYTYLVLLIDVPIMFVLFFIAGYFSLPSLNKRDSRLFLKNKFIRLGLPWIIGVLFLAPPITYMIYFSRGIPVSYLEFWGKDFWGPMVYNQSVYWFLGILFFMFVIISLIYSFNSRFRAIKQMVSMPTWKLFGFFLALTAVGFLFMNLFFPLDAWTHNYIFVYQPLRLPLYIGYFVLGIYAYQKGWFTTKGYKPGFRYWALIFILSGLLYLYSRFAIFIAAETTVILKAGNAILFNTFCLSSLMLGIALFQRYINRSSSFWKSLAANSYGIYYIHSVFLYPLTFIFIPITFSIFLKAPVVILLAILVSWGFSTVVLKRIILLSRKCTSKLGY